MNEIPDDIFHIQNNSKTNLENDGNENEIDMNAIIESFTNDLLIFHQIIEEQRFNDVKNIISKLKQYFLPDPNNDRSDLISIDGIDSFYLDIQNCLMIFKNDDIIQLVYDFLGDIGSSATDFGKSILNSNYLYTYYHFFIGNMNVNNLTTFLRFIGIISESSPECRIMLEENGIFQFFLNILSNSYGIQITKNTLLCIRLFFLYEDFESFRDNQDLGNLLLFLNKFMLYELSNECKESVETRNQLCFLILEIFNTYAGRSQECINLENNTVSSLMKFEIPISVYSILEMNIPFHIKQNLSSSIIELIDQVFSYGYRPQFTEFSAKINSLALIQFFNLENVKLCCNILHIFEYLISHHPENTLKLYESHFYEQIINSIDSVAFKLQEKMICVIISTLLNTTTTEIITIFSNETIIELIGDSLDMKHNDYTNFIPIALNRIKDMNPDSPISTQIQEIFESHDIYL